MNDPIGLYVVGNHCCKPATKQDVAHFNKIHDKHDHSGQNLIEYRTIYGYDDIMVCAICGVKIKYE